MIDRGGLDSRPDRPHRKQAAALCVQKGIRSMCNHSVHFYQDEYPAAEAAEFLAAGLLAGDACIVLLGKTHRVAVESRLRALGFDIDDEQARSGAYVAIDADQALLQLVVDGRLSGDRAREVLDSIFTQAGQGGTRSVRAVGEPAPLLFAAGNQADALKLERLVDSLAKAHGAAVFCAYPISPFCQEGALSALFSICGEHSLLRFPQGAWFQGKMPPPPAVAASAT